MEVNQGKSIKQNQCNQFNQFNPESDKIRIIIKILSQTKFAYEKILAADPVIIRR